MSTKMLAKLRVH